MALLNIENAEYRNWRVSPCYVQMQWVIPTSVSPEGKQLYMHSPSKAELARWIEERNAEFTRQIRRNQAEEEFLAEVIEALEAEGKAPHVARNLTRTEPLMLEQARRLGII